MATIDLDKKRAERGLEPHSVILDGETYELPAIVPIASLAAIAEKAESGNAADAIASLAQIVGDEVAAKIAPEELADVLSLYGYGSPESQASPLS